jgi:hypothetical protein
VLQSFKLNTMVLYAWNGDDEVNKMRAHGACAIQPVMARPLPRLGDATWGPKSHPRYIPTWFEAAESRYTLAAGKSR